MSDDALAPLSTPRLEAIRAPLAGDAPAGANIAYEDSFQTLKAEVDRLGAATGDVDFDAIVDGATQILSDDSKDIAVASYLMLGLTRTEGFAGVAEGLAAVRAVTETFWEDAFPPLRRMRGRQAALQFVAERTSDWVQSHKAEPGDREALLHAEAEGAALQAFVTDAMGNDAPAFSGLLREVREALRRLPTPEPPAAEADDAEETTDETESESAAPTRTEAPATPPAASPPPAASGTFSTTSEAETVVMRVATFLQEQDPYHATAFSLRRAVRWDAVAALPPPNVIPPPPQHRRDALAGMLAASNYPLLVAQGEGAFPQAPYHFWLDLQRLLATALRAVGPPAAAALSVVETATAALATRLPSLATLTFQDGTPFADPMTAAWIAELTASNDGSGGGAEVDPATVEAIAEAKEAAAGGDVPGAVATLMAGAGASRDHFERSVAAAQLCLGAGRPDVALGLLDGVAERIATHRLATWDPAAAGRAYRLIHTCASALGDEARAADAFGHLVTLDPAHALRSTSAPP